MKSFLKTLTVFLLLFSVTTTEAQIKQGYRFGVNLSSLSLKTKGKSSGPDTQGGIHIGYIFEIPVAGNLALQPSLLFSAKGSNYKLDTVQHSLSPVYIEIPLNLAYSFGSDRIKISLFAGPYFACGIGGLAMNSAGILKDISYGSHGNSDLKPFDIGLNFGAGINVRGLLVSVQYGMGMANISPPLTLCSEMKNKVFGISFCMLTGEN